MVSARAAGLLAITLLQVSAVAIADDKSPAARLQALAGAATEGDFATVYDNVRYFEENPAPAASFEVAFGSGHIDPLRAAALLWVPLEGVPSQHTIALTASLLRRRSVAPIAAAWLARRGPAGIDCLVRESRRGGRIRVLSLHALATSSDLGRRYTDEILRACDDDSPDVRGAGVRALSRCEPPPDAEQIVSQLLLRNSPDVRSVVLRDLSSRWLGPAKSFEILSPFSDDEDHRIRLAVAGRIVDIGRESAGGILVDMLRRSPDRSGPRLVIAECVEQLARLGPASLGEILTFAGQPQFLPYLSEFDRGAARAESNWASMCMEALKAAESGSRRFAMRALVQLARRDPSRRHELCRVGSESADTAIRLEVAREIGSWRDASPHYRDTLRLLLEDVEPSVRAVAFLSYLKCRSLSDFEMPTSLSGLAAEYCESSGKGPGAEAFVIRLLGSRISEERQVGCYLALTECRSEQTLAKVRDVADVSVVATICQTMPECDPAVYDELVPMVFAQQTRYSPVALVRAMIEQGPRGIAALQSGFRLASESLARRRALICFVPLKDIPVGAVLILVGSIEGGTENEAALAEIAIDRGVLGVLPHLR